MAEFAHNNANNVNTSYMPFELNYGHNPKIFYHENVNFVSKSKTVNKLTTKLGELISV